MDLCDNLGISCDNKHLVLPFEIWTIDTCSGDAPLPRVSRIEHARLRLLRNVNLAMAGDEMATSNALHAPSAEIGGVKRAR